MKRVHCGGLLLLGLIATACGANTAEDVREPAAFYTWYVAGSAPERILIDLAAIDRATGQATHITGMEINDSDLGRPVSLGLSFDPRTGYLHTIIDWLLGPDFKSALVRVDPETGAVTQIGALHDMHFGGTETDQCGNLYAVGFTAGFPEGSGGPPVVYSGDGKLYRFDTESGEKTPIGDTGIAAVMDLAFDPAGTLWATSENKLWTIDLETGRSTHVLDIEGVPTEGQPRNMVMSIDFDDAGTLYGSISEGFVDNFVNSAFVTIDLETGAIEMIAVDNGLGTVHGGEFVPSPAAGSPDRGRGAGAECRDDRSSAQRMLPQE